jgi:hypothetical protein
LTLSPDKRLAKIRSIIREVEDAIDKSGCDQLSLFRSAFMDIILAAGPQPSGRKKKKCEAETSILRGAEGDD